MITVKHLCKSFGAVTPLKDVNAEIEKGEVISVIGPSGTGKSTFLRCLNLLETPTSGEIVIDGQNLLDKGTDVYKLRQKMGMVFQSFNLFSQLMIIENLMLAPVDLLGKTRQQAYDRGMELLEPVSYTHLQLVHHPHALLVVFKAAGAQSVQRTLARVAEGRVPQIVPQGNGLGQVLVQAQRPGDGAGDLVHLQRVGEPGAVVVALGRKEHLRFLFQPPEGLAVDDPVPVALVAGAQGAGLLRPQAAPAVFAQGSAGRQRHALDLLGALAHCGHNLHLLGQTGAPRAPAGHAPTIRLHKYIRYIAPKPFG